MIFSYADGNRFDFRTCWSILSSLGCRGASRNGVLPAVETQWLTATEAALYLKVKPRTLVLWAREGKVPAHRLSGVRRCIWRFLRSELDAMLGLSSAVSAEKEAAC
jgi:excisionase family DNA binding protein